MAMNTTIRSTACRLALRHQPRSRPRPPLPLLQRCHMSTSDTATDTTTATAATTLPRLALPLPPPPPRTRHPEPYLALLRRQKAERTSAASTPGPALYRHGQKSFAVFPRAVRPLKPERGLVSSFDGMETARLDPRGLRAALIGRGSQSAARVGDILLVTRREGEPFAGVLVQLRHRGVNTALQLRGRLLGTGVEMWFKLYSPQVSGIDIVWRRPRRARRARLTYLRKPDHDVGSVESYVLAWRKEMKVLRGKGRADGSVETRF